MKPCRCTRAPRGAGAGHGVTSGGQRWWQGSCGGRLPPTSLDSCTGTQARAGSLHWGWGGHMHVACQGTQRRDSARNPFAHMTHAGLGKGGEAGDYSPVDSTGPQAELGEAVRASSPLSRDPARLARESDPGLTITLLGKRVGRRGRWGSGSLSAAAPLPAPCLGPEPGL